MKLKRNASSTPKKRPSASLPASCKYDRHRSASSVLKQRTRPPKPFWRNLRAKCLPEPEVLPLPFSPMIETPWKASDRVQVSSARSLNLTSGRFNDQSLSRGLGGHFCSPLACRHPFDFLN